MAFLIYHSDAKSKNIGELALYHLTLADGGHSPEVLGLWASCSQLISPPFTCLLKPTFPEKSSALYLTYLVPVWLGHYQDCRAACVADV